MNRLKGLLTKVTLVISLNFHRGDEFNSVFLAVGSL